MQRDAVPLSCWNRFLQKTDSIYSLLPPAVPSVFSIFLAVLFHLHSSDVGKAKGWHSISVPICVHCEAHHITQYSSFTPILFTSLILQLFQPVLLWAHRSSQCVRQTERYEVASCCGWSTVVSIQLSHWSPMGFADTLRQSALLKPHQVAFAQYLSARVQRFCSFFSHFLSLW